MKSRILVVDDDVDILESIETLLEIEGYNVFTTAKGDETLKLIYKNRPDLIILDLLLSGKDGAEICNEIRADEKIKDTPVVMISAHPTAKSQALKVGANEFIAKPFETKDFLEAIKRNLN
jgi:DNA-binding response OmpR family regulator